MDPDFLDVTAGLGGFIAFFLLAVALYFLMRNMNARLRRMAYREEQEAKAAEGAADEGVPKDRPETSGPQGDPDIG